jgi:hypothetical protein
MMNQWNNEKSCLFAFCVAAALLSSCTLVPPTLFMRSVDIHAAQAIISLRNVTMLLPML